MPIFWKYLVRIYLKFFLLCISSFISILLLTRFREITKILVLTHKPSDSIIFALLQIPYILPLTIPISCLISTFFIFVNLSSSHELTVLRSSGLSFSKLFLPIFVISFFISVLNFWVISELTPYCRLKAKKISKEILLNPSLIKQRFQSSPQFYIDLKPSKTNKKIAYNVVLAKIQKDNLKLFLAKEIQINKHNIIGKEITTFSNFLNENDFETSIIENEKTFEAMTKDIMYHIQNSPIRLKLFYLPTNILLNQIKYSKKIISLETLEIIRRIALSLSSIFVSILAMACGINTQRTIPKRNFFYLCFFSSIILITFILGKTFKSYILISCFLYFFPLFFSLFFSLFHLKKISRGIQ